MTIKQSNNEAEYLEDKHEEAVEAAKEWADIIEADDFHLQLDLDDKTSLDHYERQDLAKLGISGVEEDRWRSKSGNWHVLISLDKRTPLDQRFGLQAILGSDPKREAVSLVRYLNGDSQPQVLFKPKKAKKEKTYLNLEEEVAF